MNIHFVKGAVIDANTTAAAGDERDISASLALALIAQGIAYSLEPVATSPSDTAIAELVDTDGTLAANSDAVIPSQKAVKTYSAPALAIHTKTNDYTLAAGDRNALIRMNKASANSLTVPKNSDVAIAVGFSVEIRQIGAGVTTLVAAAGVTLNNPGTDLHLAKQFATAKLVKVATDEWDIVGGTTGA